MLVANFYCYPHGLVYFRARDQIYTTRDKGAGVEIFVLADYDLPSVVPYLDHVQRRARREAKSLALSDCEIVDSGMFADHFSVGGHHLAADRYWRVALLGAGGVGEEGGGVAREPSE